MLTAATLNAQFSVSGHLLTAATPNAQFTAISCRELDWSSNEVEEGIEDGFTYTAVS